jgi:hypothetical protein
MLEQSAETLEQVAGLARKLLPSRHTRCIFSSTSYFGTLWCQLQVLKAPGTPANDLRALNLLRRHIRRGNSPSAGETKQPIVPQVRNMVRRQLVLLLVPWALCTLTAIFGQSPDVPNLKRPPANCTHESPALNCTQFPTGKSVVTACVAEFAAPFVFRKKLTRTGQGDGFEYHTLTDFVNDFEGYDVYVLRAISA